jgi:hypothetical protein
MKDRSTAFRGADKTYGICHIPIEYFQSIFYGFETWLVTVRKVNESLKKVAQENKWAQDE